MSLKIKRTDNKGVSITKDGNLGLVIVCQQTTKTDHADIKRTLENSLDMISTDIFYVWGNASIFIFDTDNFTEKDRMEIKNMLSKIKHTVIFNGAQMKGSSISELYVTCSKGEIKIGKKFSTLLTMKKGK